MRSLVTLLTDFGTTDGYVAELKGTLLTQASDATLIDISHDIPPQDVDTARLALARYWRSFPRGTVHLVVVDPGVGTARRALAVCAEGRFLVGPDNGVLSPALEARDAVAVELRTPRGASATFHGRDVFAPAAAALSIGAPVRTLGAICNDPIVIATPRPATLPDGTIEGEVIAIDRFGNAITNLPPSPSAATLEAGAHRIPLRHTYADVEPGAPVALVNSAGLVEIAVRNGSAADRLGLTRGTRVVARITRA